jgi:hypothetical protein
MLAKYFGQKAIKLLVISDVTNEPDIGTINRRQFLLDISTAGHAKLTVQRFIMGRRTRGPLLNNS